MRQGREAKGWGGIREVVRAVVRVWREEVTEAISLWVRSRSSLSVDGSVRSDSSSETEACASS